MKIAGLGWRSSAGGWGRGQGGERYGEEEGREGGREMDHPASVCVMVGRVGGRVKQMSQAGDEICFFFSLSCVCSVILRPKKRVDPEKVAETQKSPLLAPPVAAVHPRDASLRLTFASC